MKDRPAPTYRLGDDFYDKIDEIAREFLDNGLAFFAEEFVAIDAFYKKATEDSSDRDDHDFRRSPRELYLLEALYFQILEKIDREAFNRAEKTVIILPQCLALMKDRCKRKRGKYGKKCAGCVPNCDVNKLTQIAQKFSVEAYFSKRKLERQLLKIKNDFPSVSVIGVSCLLTLAPGMRSARGIGVPARGVLLNYTGCRHWSDAPFATSTAIGRLQSILEEKYGIPDSASERE
jgi:hypothetical protein